MKRPLSVIIITKDPGNQQEEHHRFDAETSFPKLKLISILFKAIFSL